MVALLAIGAAALILMTMLFAARVIAVVRRKRSRLKANIHAGDYLASEARLYCIEYVRGDRILIEDCRSGDLFDADATQIGTLRLVRPESPETRMS